MCARDVNDALKEYRIADTFCILAITNIDLYPKEEWNFVFGLANMDSNCGVFSFCRHAEELEYCEDEAAKQVAWMKRSCNVMVHEIGHLFGLRHCIYYGCVLNGSNGLFESSSRKDNILCPICIAKLKLNAKFDSKERFMHLIEASRALGFDAHVQKYESLMTAAGV